MSRLTGSRPTQSSDVHRHTIHGALATLRAYPLTPLAAAVLGILHPMSHVLAQEEFDGRIEEIIVTATKRSQDLQDVPQSIAAFTTADLERLGLQDMEDYIRALPSISLINSMPGRNSVVMRGVATGSSEYRTDSMTAVYLDEQPMTTNSQQVDPWLIDIERVEALPGPQGTLFGSSSQSGTLRIITNKPNFDGWSGQLDTGISSTRGGEGSFDLGAHINMPLVDDKLAVRAVGFYSHEGGYIDNVLGMDLIGRRSNAGVVEEDFNEYDVYGGRIAARWEISDKWSLLAGVIAQKSDADGTWESDPSLGDFQVVRFFKEYRNDNWYQASMTLSGDLGFAEFSATTAYFDRDIAYEWDNMVYEQYKDSYWGNYVGYGLYNSDYTFGTIFNDQVQDRISQEVRLTSSGESRLQWMVGGFYEDVYDEWFYGAKNRDFVGTTAWYAANYYAYYYSGYDGIEYPLAPTDIGYSNTFQRTIKQVAVFGEVSYDLTEHLSVTAGARWFEYDRDELDNFQFPQGLPPFGSFDLGGTYTADAKESDTAFKFSTQYRFDDNRMAYFTFSEGFRLGGSNSLRAANTGLVPLRYSSDKLSNYEVGLKSEWLDRRLQVNVSAFFMEWTDIQINNEGGVDNQWWLRGTINGDTAEQKGVELNWTAQVTPRFLVEGSAFVADPEFSSRFELLNGNVIRDGTPMPISPDFKYWLALQYTVPGFNSWGDLWFRYDTSYQAEVYNSVDSAIARDPEGVHPSWTSANLQVGLTARQGWDVTLSAWNVWDERSINWLNNGSNNQAQWFGDPRFQNTRSYAKPRTIGLSVTKRF